jgi:cell division protein FtsB
MRVSLRKIVFACVVLAGTTYGIAMLRGTHSIATFEEKRKQIDQLEKENQALHREIAARQNHLDVISKNPDELKLEIQKRLKLVAPGTKQFILQDGTGSSATDDPQQ